MSGSNNSAGSPGNKNDALVQRIKAILDRTSPSSWVKGGEALNPNVRHDKPRQTWEIVFSTKISAGTLVVRCSIPLSCIFLGKGYQYQPAARESYYVELRGTGWNPAELTDPFKRHETSDRRCEVLASGPLASQIFAYVHHTYENFQQNEMATLKQEAIQIVEKVLGKLRQDPDALGPWEERRETPNEICFINFLDDFCIEACRAFNGRQEKIFIKVERNGLTTYVDDYSLSYELLSIVYEQEQTSKLQALTKVLEEV
jgi:hypothetical protein